MIFGQERFAQTNALLSRLVEEKKHLIAVHRGSWGGNICQNTVGAYTAAVAMGADMVEADVNSSTDGVLYSFHDGHEPDVFGVTKNIKTMDSAEIEGYHPLNTVGLRSAGRISRLGEVLDYLPENILLNIDRAWDIFPQLLAFLDKYPKAQTQVVIKAPLKAKDAFAAMNAHPVKYMFMPICYSMQDVEEALSYADINTVGCELIAFSEETSCIRTRTSPRCTRRACTRGSTPFSWATGSASRSTASWTTTSPCSKTRSWAGAACSPSTSTSSRRTGPRCSTAIAGRSWASNNRINRGAAEAPAAPLLSGGTMQTIMIGTSNPAKLTFFEQLLCGYDVHICGTGALTVLPPEETGATPIENAVLKAEYYGRFAPVVIGVDSGLYFHELPMDDPRQPGLHVRSPRGQRLCDEEMIAYYAEKVSGLGGRVTAYYLDGTAIRTPDGRCHTFLPTTEELLETAFFMTDTPVATRKPGWPLDSLCIDRQGVPFLDPGRTRNAQAGWAYAPRLRAFIAGLLALDPR